MGLSLSRLQNASFQSLFSSEATMQAQHFARSKMDYLIYKGYNELAVQNKKVIDKSTFKDSVALGNVTTDTDGISHRLVTVSVYNEDETQPRAKLQQVFYSNDANRFVTNGSSATSSISLNYDADSNKLYAKVNGETKELGSGVPVGTVIAWASNSIPTEGGIWLECNGQSCAAYPKLVAVLGKNTVPDYRGRFLQADSVAGKQIEAGLPDPMIDILYREDATNSGVYTNLFGNDGYSLPFGNSGAIKNTPETDEYMQSNRSKGYNAYLYPMILNVVYGSSDTVQPPAYTVRYFIKAQ